MKLRGNCEKSYEMGDGNNVMCAGNNVMCLMQITR